MRGRRKHLLPPNECLRPPRLCDEPSLLQRKFTTLVELSLPQRPDALRNFPRRGRGSPGGPGEPEGLGGPEGDIAHEGESRGQQEDRAEENRANVRPKITRKPALSLISF